MLSLSLMEADFMLSLSLWERAGVRVPRGD